MTGNYEDYALMWYDDPYEECYEWFWTSINMDECLGKDFLEHLQQMVDDIDKGTVKTYSLDEVMGQLNKLKEEEWE